MASLGSLKSAIFDREEKKMRYQSHIRGLNAYDRHKQFVKDYVQFYGNAKDARDVKLIKTDQDTIREGYRFILSEEDDMDSTWEKRLVKRYYDKLFKEYCIADMSQYKRGKIGLRWRTEKEVVSGKGQFICGNKHCNEKDDIASYEVNFSYIEEGEDKQALVKLVACKGCAEKLAYRRQKDKQKEKMRLEEQEINALIQRLKPDKRRHEDDHDDQHEKSSDRRKKGKRSSPTSCGKDDKVEDNGADDPDNFDEFLEGMFP